MGLFCIKCGTQLPDGAAFCYKCGNTISPSAQTAAPSVQKSQYSSEPQVQSQSMAGTSGITTLKCTSCGAPLSPKFGEMVITCDYCGTSVTLGSNGWKNIQKHTMLPVKMASRDDAISRLHGIMDKGLLKHHLQENSVLEEINLTFVPY